MKEKLGLYIHVPFCERKCLYCDFYSLKHCDSDEQRYMDAVKREIQSYSYLKNDYEIDTIFVGGGTPSVLKSGNMYNILNEIDRSFSILSSAEITTEANPNSLTKDKIKEFKDSGINRISIGVQSLNNDILKKIGRLHNSYEALTTIDNVFSVGINNLNVDVMFNIPGQTLKDVDDTLSQIIDRGVNHISFYSLKLEEGTPMFMMEKKGQIHMIEDEDERLMYYSGRSLMKRHSINQYEISNFAKEGFECKHNIGYWTGKPYIGIGPSAHSYFGNKRFSNESSLNLYCSSENPTSYRVVQETIDRDGQIFEYIMLRLRMNKGFKLSDFRGKFGIDFLTEYKDVIARLSKLKLIEIDGDTIRLTYKGMDISNYVFEEFIS